MRRFLLGILFLIETPVLLFGQTMRMTPDSGAQGNQLSVSIAGNGTRFSATNNVSFVGVVLEGSGYSSSSSSASLLNDSTVHASIQVPSGAPEGIYLNLIVEVVDSTEHSYTQDSAFHVSASPPNIASISPGSAYNGQTIAIQITGQNTNFLAGSTPSVSFQRNGTTFFTATVDTIYSATSIGASVTVPGGTPSGTSYNIIVQNGTYSDTGINKFSSLGPSPTTARVPMRMIPDSGFPQEQLSVTIVGTGTHFAASNNISGVSIKIEQSGNLYDEATYASVVNDTTIRASLEVANGMQIGSYYDLVIQETDSTEHTYIQDSAFHVVQPPPSIVSLSPSSAYDSQTVAVQIVGQNTDFLTGTTPTVSFQQSGTSYFTGQSVTVSGNTSIAASITIPASLAAGAYDVVVQNGTYSDTGKNKFTVLGPLPTVSIIPDSGAASTEFGVTIVGQFTNFTPTSNISEPLPMSIDLRVGGISYYHTTDDTVFSSTHADAVFTLPDTLTPGTYNAEIHGSNYSGSSFDYSTTFLVTPHPIIIASNNNAPRADTATVTVTANGVNFISGTQEVTTVQLVKEDPDTILASKVTVTSNTTLSAFFTIPANAQPGFYDIAITEPGTNRIVTAPNAFTVEAPNSVADNNPFSREINLLHVSPNPTQQDLTISFTLDAPAPVHLRLFDALGRTVATLCNRNLGSGPQSFDWRNRDLPAGSYFYELSAGEEMYGGSIMLRH